MIGCDHSTTKPWYEAITTIHYHNEQGSHKAQYNILDKFAQSNEAIRNAATFDEAVAITIKSKWADQYEWLYHYDVRFANEVLLAASNAGTGAKSLEEGLRGRGFSASETQGVVLAVVRT